MRKEGLPFPCGENGCRESFISKGARNQHKKAKHRIKVHSFGDLKDMIENKPNVVQAGNTSSGWRRWLRTPSKQFLGVMVAVTLLVALAASLGLIGWRSAEDISNNTPRSVSTTVVKPQQK